MSGVVAGGMLQERRGCPAKAPPHPHTIDRAGDKRTRMPKCFSEVTKKKRWKSVAAVDMTT